MGVTNAMMVGDGMADFTMSQRHKDIIRSHLLQHWCINSVKGGCHGKQLSAIIQLFWWIEDGAQWSRRRGRLFSPIHFELEAGGALVNLTNRAMGPINW